MLKKETIVTEARKLGHTYVSSKCTGCKGNSTGPEFRNLGDSELDSGEYILLGYKEVSGPARV